MSNENYNGTFLTLTRDLNSEQVHNVKGEKGVCSTRFRFIGQHIRVKPQIPQSQVFFRLAINFENLIFRIFVRDLFTK